MAEKKEQTYEFQSEVKQLLDILVYSLYKNKEVFLRELVSNAADALNKMQFEFLTVPDLEGKDQELKITIAVDKKHGKLVVEDNGVGMTREELVQNIGTIAHSGTLDYLKRLKEAQAAGPADLIGKFGVGFYSSFMAAREIHILTRSWQKGSRTWLWKSTGESSYTIEETEREGRGTRIELLLKKDEKEYLETFRLKGVILKHSKFVPFPIYLDGEKIERQEAVWTQPKSKLSEKDYADFYKFLENTQEEPETWLHLSSDAPVQFHSLLYEASGNRFLARALEEMYTLVYRLSYFALDRMGSVRANVEEHRTIMEAVRDGDTRAAERLVQQHIAHFQSMVEGLL